jgi:hypothetical protein
VQDFANIGIRGFPTTLSYGYEFLAQQVAAAIEAQLK